mmetsp:Transcript_9491/g.11811  ORF Transcript_9491/g.11811 Transcript_9491/m.11811 type:complete len:107 (-) Transcript_9491:526-846(-)
MKKKKKDKFPRTKGQDSKENKLQLLKLQIAESITLDINYKPGLPPKIEKTQRHVLTLNLKIEPSTIQNIHSSNDLKSHIHLMHIEPVILSSSMKTNELLDLSYTLL